MGFWWYSDLLDLRFYSFWMRTLTSGRSLDSESFSFSTSHSHSQVELNVKAEGERGDNAFICILSVNRAWCLSLVRDRRRSFLLLHASIIGMGRKMRNQWIRKPAPSSLNILFPYSNNSKTPSRKSGYAKEGNLDEIWLVPSFWNLGPMGRLSFLNCYPFFFRSSLPERLPEFVCDLVIILWEA